MNPVDVRCHNHQSQDSIDGFRDFDVTVMQQNDGLQERLIENELRKAHSE